MLIEPIIFQEMKQGLEKLLRNDERFLDRVQVLLVAYFNLGVSQAKLGNVTNSKTIFEHGYKMSKKYLGSEHHFSHRFERRVQQPAGNTANAPP